MLFPTILTLAMAQLLIAGQPVSVLSEKTMEAAADYSRSKRGKAMVVLVGGKKVFERYDNGGAADKLQLLASGSKSFVGVAAVAATQDGILNLDDPASQSIIQWQRDPKKASITYRQLLTLTSGLTPGERGSAVRSPSWSDIADKPMVAKPGTRFEYGAYHLNSFAYALERKLEKETFEDYLNRRVFDVIGVKVDWQLRCADGHPQVGGGAYMTAVDWAMFGEFIRQKGTWKNTQVIDAASLAMCFQGSEQNPAYGLTWWLKKPVSAEQRRRIPILSREWGEVANSDWVPGDLVAACGAGKQRLYIVPSLELVVVRQGALLSLGFTDFEFLSLLLRGKPANN